MSILGWIFVILLAVYAPVTLVFNIAHMYYLIKCFKVKGCSKRACHFKGFCGKYDEAITEAEAERLLMLIEKRKNNSGGLRDDEV